jgi:hypothetical protein
VRLHPPPPHDKIEVLTCVITSVADPDPVGSGPFLVGSGRLGPDPDPGLNK